MTAQDKQAGDFFSTPVPWLLIGITLLPFLVATAACVFRYLGIEIHIWS